MSKSDFERRNRAPIFLNCLSRGGSNILWNLFLSHPGACSPIRETLEIFRIDRRRPTLTGLKFALLSAQPTFFDQWRLTPRPELNVRAARYMDRVLYREKMRTVSDAEMCFKNPTERYREDEVARARLVAKNNNGLLFLTETLRQIYPEATFFGLVREPLALYESHRRRRLHGSPQAFADFYVTLVGKMVEDAERATDCHLVRFEDVLSEPVSVFHRVCEAAGLETSGIEQLRFKSKEHFLPDGSRGADWAVGRHHWFELDAVGRFFEPKINDLQADRLDPSEAAVILERTEELRRKLGYGAQADDADGK
ncbi:MAG: sulfotransferase [Thermoanaerobaculia bacterium]|nr:sulfotransferase [Thermoanaerobaculia bacterium]